MKDMQDLYSESKNMSLRIIREDPSKSRCMPSSWIWGFSVLKMMILPILKKLFVEIENLVKLILKFMSKCKGIRINSILKKKDKFTLSDSKTFLNKV